MDLTETSKFDIKCPFCDKGNAVLSVEKKKRTFRKEEFKLYEYYYKCNSCKEEFTTTEIDTINTKQLDCYFRENR